MACEDRRKRYQAPKEDWITKPKWGETIDSLALKKEPVKERNPRYVSKYKDTVKAFYVAQKLPHKTLGPYKPIGANPNDFLKKHVLETKIATLAEQKKSLKSPRREHIAKKPSVPKCHEKPVLSAKPVTKNFIQENIRNVLKASPRKPVPKQVDNPNGDVFELEPTGLVPKYSLKKDYGVIPEYLIRRKEDMVYSHEKFREFMEEQMSKDAPTPFLREERQTMLLDLKSRLEETLREYCGLPIITDSQRKIDDKKRLEEDLKYLENCIEFLERNTDVFVNAHP